jgi:hypothetical protein
MTFPFIGPKLKIERAYAHLVDLERSEREFFEHNQPSLVVERDLDSGDKLAKVKLNAPTPEIIHVIAGELIYQLRSSLDQIAVACARLSSGRTRDRDVYFPCGDSISTFEDSCTRYLAGFDVDLANQIRHTKAYDGGNDNLRAVFRMGNIDKHLNLVPTAAYGNINGISNFTVREAKIGFIISGPNSLYDGLVISNLGTNGTITPNNPNAHIAVSGYIVLGNVSIYNGNPIIPFLAKLCDATRDVYENIVNHCQTSNRF